MVAGDSKEETACGRFVFCRDGCGKGCDKRQLDWQEGMRGDERRVRRCLRRWFVVGIKVWRTSQLRVLEKGPQGECPPEGQEGGLNVLIQKQRLHECQGSVEGILMKC